MLHTSREEIEIEGEKERERERKRESFCGFAWRLVEIGKKILYF
jgi:hypothetical protein